MDGVRIRRRVHVRHREQMHCFGFGPTPTPSRGALGITGVQHRAGPTSALLQVFSRVHL